MDDGRGFVDISTGFGEYFVCARHSRIAADWQTSTVIVIVCPGQGSQTPGFLTPWIAESTFRDQLTGISDAVGIDLVAHGTVSDADTIRDTAVAQPLIVAAGLLTLSALLADGRRDSVGGIAGQHVQAAGGGVSELERLRHDDPRSPPA